MPVSSLIAPVLLNSLFATRRPLELKTLRPCRRFRVLTTLRMRCSSPTTPKPSPVQSETRTPSTVAFSPATHTP